LMLVTFSLEYWRTRFQTLITSPQVVSTSTQPFSSSRLRVATSVPKAGMIATSPARKRPPANGDFRAKGGNDRHVAGLQSCQFILGRLGRNDLDAQVANLVVDFRVVNDLTEQVNGFFRRKIFSRRVGEINRALDAVAKAEFLREFDGEVAGGDHVAVGTDALDDFAAVM